MELAYNLVVDFFPPPKRLDIESIRKCVAPESKNRPEWQNVNTRLSILVFGGLQNHESQTVYERFRVSNVVSSLE